MYPFFSVGFRYVSCYVLVENAYVGMCGVCCAEVVTLSDKSLSLVSQVGDVVRDVALGDVVSGGSEEDSAELGFPGTTRGGLLHYGKRLLCFPGV